MNIIFNKFASWKFFILILDTEWTNAHFDSSGQTRQHVGRMEGGTCSICYRILDFWLSPLKNLHIFVKNSPILRLHKVVCWVYISINKSNDLIRQIWNQNRIPRHSEPRGWFWSIINFLTWSDMTSNWHQMRSHDEINVRIGSSP